jgi:hypothetical protein
MSHTAPRAVVIIAVVIIAVMTLVAACGGEPTSAPPSPSPTASGAQPTFELVLDGAVDLPAFPSDPSASLNECAPASSGGWTYTYAGGTPFLTLDLSVYSPATTGANPSDFDLDIVAPGSRAVRVVPSGRREGVQGDGTIHIEPRPDGGVTISLDGSAVTLVGGPASIGTTTVHLELDCPGAV